MMNNIANPATDLLNHINQISDSIIGASDSGHLTAALWQLNEALGCDGAVFMSFARDDETLESYRYVVACPLAWCNEYNAKAWFTIDPCLLYAMTNTEPALIRDIPLRSTGQKNMMAAASMAGFKSGLVIPAHSSIGRTRMGVLYVGSSDPDFFNAAALARTRILLRALSGELLDWWIRKARTELLGDATLSSEEIELLRLSHGGHKSKEIAQHLSVSKAAVDQKLFRISSKFGTSSRKIAGQMAHDFGML